MKDKQKQGAPQGFVQEIKRHFDIVAEKLDDKISTIAEQYGDIKKTLDSHSATLASHTEMIGSIKEDVEVMKMDIAATKTDIEVMKTDVAETKTDMAIVKSDIEFIKGGIKKKVDYDEFIALERRMTLLESKVRR